MWARCRRNTKGNRRKVCRIFLITMGLMSFLLLLVPVCSARPSPCIIFFFLLLSFHSNLPHISTQQIKLMPQSLQTMTMFACDPCLLSGTLLALYHKCVPIVLQVCKQRHFCLPSLGYELCGHLTDVHLTPMAIRYCTVSWYSPCANHDSNPEPWTLPCYPLLTQSLLNARA